MKTLNTLIISTLVASLFLACASKENSIPTATTTKGMVTMTIGQNVRPTNGGNRVMVTLGSYSFDVYRDRREMVREVYQLCVNPSQQIQTFIKNRLKSNQNKSQFAREAPAINFYYANQDLKGELYPIFTCTYDEDGLLEFNGKEPPNRADYVKLDEMVDEVIGEKYYGKLRDGMYDSFSYKFAGLIDTAKAQAKAQNIKITPPSKEIPIKFGVRDINPATGEDRLVIFKEIVFDVNKDRRDLFKAVYNVCANPNYNMKNYINANRDEYILTLYPNADGHLIEFKKHLLCWHDTAGKIHIGTRGAALTLKNTKQSQKTTVTEQLLTKLVDKIRDKKESDEIIDTPELDEIANRWAVTTSNPGIASADTKHQFHEWTRLLDAATAINAQKTKIKQNATNPQATIKAESADKLDDTIQPSKNNQSE